MYGNPYYNQQRFQPIEPMTQPINNQQYINTMPTIPTIPNNNTQIPLLGKSVDSIDVVKSMDIPLDGRTSYFPLTDGSAIVTKKLLSDGTSQMVVYKPYEEEEKETSSYLTMQDIEGIIPDIDIEELKELKDDIKSIKKQLREIKESKDRHK